MSHPKATRAVFLVTHSSTGGVQEIWADLAEGFRQHGHETLLAALYPSPDADATQTTSSHIPWTYISPRKPTSIREVIATLIALVRFLRLHSPSVVFTAMPAANVLAPFASKLARSNISVVTSHHSPANTHNRVLQLLDGLTGSLDIVTAIVSVSRSVDRSLHRKPACYRAKQRVIANALPPRVEAYVDELGTVHDHVRRRIAIASGRLVAQKNYPVLLRAATQLPDVEIHIIGSGSDEHALRTLAAQLDVADRVHFIGFLPREIALKRISECDVFVQPSLFEGHSLALIEAAKLGIPLVVSDVPVQVEGITAPSGKRCGVVVGVNDDATLASEILRLMNEPGRLAEFSSRALELGDGACFAEMLSAYEALAAGPHQL